MDIQSLVTLITIYVFFFSMSKFIIGVKRDTERIERKLDKLLGTEESEE